jgi:hypothetical protein
MANNPKKVKDPTEVALSAIQEALNISDTNVDTNRNSLGNELAPQTSPSAPPPYSDMSFDTRGSAERPVFDPIEEPRSPRRAANDVAKPSDILQAIQAQLPQRLHACLRVWRRLGDRLRPATVSFLPALQAAIRTERRRAGAGRPCCVVLCAGAVVLFPREPAPGAARKCG